MHGVSLGTSARCCVSVLATLAMLAGALAGFSGSAFAQRKQAAMAIDANSGQVLYSQAADEPRYPASLTKMMTLYIAFGEIEAGRLSYATPITVSEAAASVAPSKLELEAGSQIALIDAMKALVTKSANDMAVAIAEKIAGTEPAFARLMTERARQIGMNATTFRNAHGLPDPEQISTARDMLTLALRLHDDFPKHYRLFALKYFTYKGDTYRNHNTLLFHYPGTEGMKTGYTRASGFNLVTSVKREGKHVVAAVFGGETAGSRNAHMRSILTRTLAKATTVKTRKPAPLLIARPALAPRPQPQVALKAAPRPAQRPKPPAPAVVQVPARPLPEAAAPASAAVALVADKAVRTPPAAAPAPPTPRPAEPKVEIALVKVRSSLQAPPEPPARQVQVATAAAAPLSLIAPQGEWDAAAPAPRLDFNAAPRADMAGAARPAPAPTTPPMATETVLAKTGPAGNDLVQARAPGTLEQQLAVLTQQPALAERGFAATTAALPASAAAAPEMTPLLRPAAQQASSAKPKAVPVAIVRGQPPSTLAAQAERLSRQQPAALAATPAPQHLGGPNVSGDSQYEIQIGTFASAEEAEARLAAVQSKTAIVNGHAALTLPIDQQGRMAYRARFAGFSSERATAACTELRRSQIDCFVARPE